MNATEVKVEAAIWELLWLALPDEQHTPLLTNIAKAAFATGWLARDDRDAERLQA